MFFAITDLTRRAGPSAARTSGGGNRTGAPPSKRYAGPATQRATSRGTVGGVSDAQGIAAPASRRPTPFRPTANRWLTGTNVPGQVPVTPGGRTCQPSQTPSG